MGLVGLVLLVAAAGLMGYRSLDALYPQELWKYFRPLPTLASGSVLYRNADGQLYLTPVNDTMRARRLLDQSVAASVREVVRDAIALPDGKQIVYLATEKKEGQLESDHLKVLTLDGRLVRHVALTEALGEAIRPAVYSSSSGRYVAVTSRDRTRVYYYDVVADLPLVMRAVDASPPEAMLWHRNADLRTASLAGQPAFAASPDGKLRAQVRQGPRRAPDCAENGPRCEAVQELVISSGTVAGSSNPPVTIYGAFSDFSADGWGPIPEQPAQRLYGRLVWSPDGSQLLFSTLDGAAALTYAISLDGKTQPRLVLQAGEALDWIP